MARKDGLRLFEEQPKDRATRSMAAGVALRGGQLSRTQFHDPGVPYCDTPEPVLRYIRAGGSDRPLEVTAFRPCRRCAKCLQFRQLQWRERCLNEIEHSPRTWLVTLTFDPHHLAGILFEAARFSHLGTAAEDRAAYSHVQKYLKRLRKAASARCRYMFVFERGEETGRPHYHALLHEVDRPISKRLIEANWRSNVHARLVKSGRGSASYVTKYLTKSLDVRPRASAGYGNRNHRPPSQGPQVNDSERKVVDTT